MTFELTPLDRDVLLSLLNAAKDDCSVELKKARNPSQYAARAVEHLRKMIAVYVAIEDKLRH